MVYRILGIHFYKFCSKAMIQIFHDENIELVFKEMLWNKAILTYTI